MTDTHNAENTTPPKTPPTTANPLLKVSAIGHGASWASTGFNYDDRSQYPPGLSASKPSLEQTTGTESDTNARVQRAMMEEAQYACADGRTQISGETGSQSSSTWTETGRGGSTVVGTSSGTPMTEAEVKSVGGGRIRGSAKEFVPGTPMTEYEVKSAGGGRIRGGAKEFVPTTPMTEHEVKSVGGASIRGGAKEFVPAAMGCAAKGEVEKGEVEKV